MSREIHSSKSSIYGRYYLKYIDGIIENAILFDSAVSNNKNENSVFFHYLYSVVKENGHNSIVKLIVEEQETPVKGDIKREYKLIDIKKHQPSDVGSANSLAYSQAADDIKIISDLYKFVNTYDRNFK